MKQVKKMDDKEKSFLGTLHFDNHYLSASIGFQKAYLEIIPPSWEESNNYNSGYTQVIHHKTVHNLYASSYPKNEPTEFYFRHIINGEYTVYSRSQNFHFGKHLFINNGVISASDIPAETDYFSFKQNGQKIQIHEKPEEEIFAEFVCEDGGIEFKNIENLNDRGENLTAQVVSKGGHGPLGNIRLKIIRRNVDWLK